jgi:DNA-binding winged helix-turn-helix (wHTH) protein
MKMNSELVTPRLRFGEFELDPEVGELRRNGSRLKLQPQPFKLLLLLVRRAGAVVTRDEIRQELWADGTYVDFDQAMNFCIKQVRDVLRDQSDRPTFIQTVPKRGYRFIAPVEPATPPQGRAGSGDGTTIRLQKALWANIAELHLAAERRKRNTRIAVGVLLVAACAAALFYVVS